MNSLITVLKLVMRRLLFLDLKITSTNNVHSTSRWGARTFVFYLYEIIKKFDILKKKKLISTLSRQLIREDYEPKRKLTQVTYRSLTQCRRHKLKKIQSAREFDNGLAKHSTTTCTQIQIICVIIEKELI